MTRRVLSYVLLCSGAACARPEDAGAPTLVQEIVPAIFPGDLRDVPIRPPYAPDDSVLVMHDIEPPGLAEPSDSAGGPPPAPAARRDSGAVNRGVTFEGIGARSCRRLLKVICMPPDPVGDIGPTHYVQAVNGLVATYDRQGNTLSGPSGISDLWQAQGGPCSSEDNADPIVRHDRSADRWLLGFWTRARDSLALCVAISRTPNPVTGGWFLYQFPQDFPLDYPKIGVWPDAYYVGTRRGYPSAPLDVFALERAEMVAGRPARAVHFEHPPPTLFLMPADVDGPPPPVGTPGHFLRVVDGDVFDGPDRLEIFEFTVDWQQPRRSTFRRTATLPTDPFDAMLCANNNTFEGPCVEQPGAGNGLLWSFSHTLMWRVGYRNLDTMEALVANHTVNFNRQGHAGVRWYVLDRRPGGSWAIQMQSTFAPPLAAPVLNDPLNRWMGSIAMDRHGGIAIGYSSSSATLFPDIRFTGRLATSGPPTLSINEVVLRVGGGAQLGSPWGDYSTMDVDPIDDCTFWYTNEYYEATSNADYRTLVASFRLPLCPDTVSR